MPSISILIDTPHLDQYVSTPNQDEKKFNQLKYLPDSWQAILHNHVWQTAMIPLIDTQLCSERAFVMQIACLVGFLPNESLPCAAYEANHNLSEAPQSPAYAYLTPCHYQLGRDHILLRALKDNPRDTEDIAHLMQAIDFLWLDSKPYPCKRDILPVHRCIPHENQYLWQHPLLEHLFCHSFSQSIDRPLDTWLPQHRLPTENSQASRYWQKLHNEIQMLWFNHPINLARKKDHLQEINGLWLSAAGKRPSSISLPFTHIISACTAELYWLKNFCTQHQTQYTTLEKANFSQLSKTNNNLLFIIDSTTPNPQKWLAMILKLSYTKLSVKWIGQHVSLQAQLQSNLMSRIWHRIMQ